MTNKFTRSKFLALAAYLLMVGVNALANILPINGLTTGAVSDSYPNLFAPAGVTFSIWGLIYLLLLGYLVYQFTANKVDQKKFTPVNILFAVSSLLNSAWIFAWHYRLIWLSMALMLFLLFVLIWIADLLNGQKLSKTEKLVFKIPFGIYFGWITVATIANITVFLVSINWNIWGVPDYVWMMLVLLAGLGIGVWRMQKDKNMAYGLVPVWAYLGIWLKHTSPSGFNNEFPAVVGTVIFCIVVLVLSNVWLLARKKAI